MKEKLRAIKFAFLVILTIATIFAIVFVGLGMAIQADNCTPIIFSIEITRKEYERVATWKKTYPELKPIIDSFYTDEKINKIEFTKLEKKRDDIRWEQTKEALLK